MKNIEITQENKEVYQEYLDIKNGIIPIKNLPLFTIGFLLAITGIASGVIGCFYLISAISGLVSPIITVIASLGIVSGMTYVVHYLAYKLPVKVGLKNFKKKYPNFDTNININEVKEKLDKINDMSKFNEVTEEEKHLSFYQDDFKKMTNSEKVAFLEREKEFWSNVNQVEKEVVIQKKKEF